MRYDNKHLRNRIVLLDGEQFISCKFERCVIQYAGGVMPIMQDCSFGQCRWQLVGAADLVVKFLRILYHDGGDNGIAHEVIKRIQEPIAGSGDSPDGLPGTPMTGFSGRN